MARAKRHFIPGHVWHITHRCHKRAFLFKFAKDRNRWIEWLYQAQKRHSRLSVLDYMVTSNHIHLLVSDTGGQNVIPDSIKLMAGRTGQEYNIRKHRQGAFWQDRYHATAVESSHHLHRCITYIDLNMVRAGAVDHPGNWKWCGYNEIQNPRIRKSIIDFERLMELLGFDAYEQLKDAHSEWIDNAVREKRNARESEWSQAIAVGSEAYIKKVKKALGFKAKGRKIRPSGGLFELREEIASYEVPDKDQPGNYILWNI